MENLTGSKIKYNSRAPTKKCGRNSCLNFRPMARRCNTLYPNFAHAWLIRLNVQPLTNRPNAKEKVSCIPF